MKIQKKKNIFFLGGGGVRGGGVLGRVGEVRVDVIEELKFFGKFTKKDLGGVGTGQVGVGLVGGGGGGSQGGCERRIEVFVKF